MSDWVTYRDATRPETAAQTVARVLVAQPGLKTSDYVRLCLAHDRRAVSTALYKLKCMGLATAARRAGAAGRGAATEQDWQPTARLIRMLDAGEPVRVSRRARLSTADDLEDDGWTPPVNYIGGTRARILGLRRVA